MTDLPPPFWCWTEGEPSTFRCRERGHDVREAAPIGVLPSSAWTDSQQDLLHLESQLRDAEREGYKALAERDNLRELNAALVAEVNRLGTDLASARSEKEQAEQLSVTVALAMRRVEDDRDRIRIELQNENALLLAKLDRQRVNADLARRDLKRVSDWHAPSPHEDEAGLCGGCGGHWPCHTRQILDGREPASWDDMSETYPGSGIYE